MSNPIDMLALRPHDDPTRAALWDRHVRSVHPLGRFYASVHPDIAARGNEDRWVSVREPFPGCFLWSWCAYGARRWREATASERS